MVQQLCDCAACLSRNSPSRIIHALVKEIDINEKMLHTVYVS